MVAKAHLALKQQGCHSAFNDAAPFILLFCARVVSKAYPHLQIADRDNIAQESLIKVWRHIESFDPSQRACAWIGPIARNAAVDYMRRDASRIRHVPIEFTLESSNEDLFAPNDNGANDPFRKVVEQEEEVRFAALQDSFLNSLSEGERVVALGRMEGLSYDAIAEKEGVPVGTVKSRLHAMRARLKKRFNSDPSPT